MKLNHQNTKPTAKKQLLDLTLSGIDELELFDTPEQRQEALSQIGDEAANPRSWGFWLGVVIVAGSAAGVMFFLRWLLPLLGLHGLWRELTTTVIIAATFWFVLRWLHRSGIRRELRQKLINQNIPVCMGCGYLLRGLPLSSMRCPECGRTFDKRICEILADSSTSDPLP